MPYHHSKIRGTILQDNEYLPMIRAPSSLAKTRQRGGGNDKGETFGLQITIHRLGDILFKCSLIFNTEHEKNQIPPPPLKWHGSFELLNILQMTSTKMPSPVY